MYQECNKEYIDFKNKKGSVTFHALEKHISCEEIFQKRTSINHVDSFLDFFDPLIRGHF